VKYLWFSLFILGTLFSWGMSLVPGNKSADISNQISKPIIDAISNPDKPLTDQEVAHTRFISRKVIGHFLLNAGIGFCGFISFYLITKKNHLSVLMMLLIGFLIASISELLQFIPIARYPSWTDVLINLVGMFSSIMILYLVSLLLNGKSKTC